jgi:Lrp/AsnC family transcriptional regulator, leucine-responsive regulatory protein
MTGQNAELDRLDRVIIRELRINGRMSFRELGLKAGLSANATAERVRRLAKAGPDMLEAALAELPEVQRATWTTGNFDFTLEVACMDQEDLVRLIEKIRERGCRSPRPIRG